jgi:D-alanyl-D-alanine carboxypeptidase
VHRRSLAALILASVTGLGTFALVGGRPALPPVGMVSETAPAPVPTVGAGRLPSPGPTPPLPPIAPVRTPRPVPPRAGLVFTDRLAGVLQEAVDAVRSRTGIPGISATIIFPDGTRWTGASGLADVSAGIPVTEETPFAIASITKTFTAALVLDLVSEGRLALDEPVAPHLPGLGLDPRISVRHLLDHTSGLRDFFDRRADEALLSAPAEAWTAERALAFVGKPHFAPGAGWEYSNTNYLLLGVLVERLTGEDLALQFRTRLFDPLGLSTAFMQGREAPRAPLARGYRFTGPSPTQAPIEISDGTAIVPFTSVVTASGGAGVIAASSVDVARWAWSLYRDQVLEPGSVALMRADVALVARFRPRIPYGLGVQAATIGGFETLGHSGRFLGARSAVRYLPAEGLAIAVLTNQSRTDPGVIVRELLRIVLPPPGRCGVCFAPD